ncbi:hypothetical protein L207DRAFT_538785 [Hyaloscypha variabilis F]|uniref:Fungal N-terminal domain-containing protein n=1 Tax=Hyaloscypha variabilis (strain UAMH 11265 / GT02V1 / F) TaxID=1149755 RepID=A0A2J6QTK9_HYAVF|nr:hypothetical protein L207DRAFT_538785 [Hyaloscypha variabilis F]
MDPFSIRLSALTFLSTAAAVEQKVESLRDADKTLRAVLEELSDFQTLVQQVNILVDQYQAEIPEQQRADLTRLLGRARSKLEEIDVIVEGVTKKGGGGVVKAKKLQWVRRESKVAALQMGLNDLKLTLVILLNSITTSCCLRLQTTLVGSNVQNTSVSSGSQAKQMHGRQEVAKAPFLSRTNILRISTQLNPDSSKVENTRSKGEKFSQVCLSCSKAAIATRYKRQPVIRISLLQKRLLLPDFNDGQEYAYLDSMVSSWQAETTNISIKVLPEPNIPNLELRVRGFRPSSSFDPYTSWSSFDDQLGLLPSRTACTRPYAIPYTDYVECGKLEMWAKESLRWKLERYKNSAGRSLLSTLGLEGRKVFRNNKLIDAAFTFTALSWVATSQIFASRRNYDTTSERNVPAAIPSKTPRHLNLERDHRPHIAQSPKHASDSQARKFADDEINGISSCPAAIRCQLSLLCFERARELEHDVLIGLQTLILSQTQPISDAERLLVAYISLALMMDAYEKYLAQFEDLRQQEPFRRCLHLVEALAAELGFLLRGATMRDFLHEVAGGMEKGAR